MPGERFYTSLITAKKDHLNVLCSALLYIFLSCCDVFGFCIVFLFFRVVSFCLCLVSSRVFLSGLVSSRLVSGFLVLSRFVLPHPSRLAEWPVEYRISKVHVVGMAFKSMQGNQF